MVSYLETIWRYRYFWFALVKFDLVLRYRRSVLGAAWSLLQPLGMAAILCLVFHRLLGVSVAEYGPFILASITLWNFLSQTATTGCHSFLQAQPYIRQHPAPLAIYPLQMSLGAVVHLVISLGMVVALTTLVRGPTALAAVPVLLPVVVLLAVLGWAVATVAGIANVYFRDTEHVLPVALQGLFYLTPVLYPSHLLHSQGLGCVADWNPLTVFFDLVRTPLLTGQVPSAEQWLLGSGIALAAVLVAVGLFARVHRNLAAIL